LVDVVNKLVDTFESDVVDGFVDEEMKVVDVVVGFVVDCVVINGVDVDDNVVDEESVVKVVVATDVVVDNEDVDEF